MIINDSNTFIAEDLRVALSDSGGKLIHTRNV